MEICSDRVNISTYNQLDEKLTRESRYLEHKYTLKKLQVN